MAHWSDNYIGQPYEINTADCARLLSKVRKIEFNLPVPADIELERANSRLGRVSQIGDLVSEYGVKTESPKEGDAVLMLHRGRPSHIGVYCIVDGEECVLHAMESVKMVVRHKLSDLHKAWLTVEGYYSWK